MATGVTSDPLVDLEITREYSDRVIHASHLLWSPDGSRLVLTIAIDICGPGWSNAVVQVDAATLSQRTLFYEQGRVVVTEEWPQADRILLKEESVMPAQEEG